MTNTKQILPGATLGILGSGQLGRMFALAAAQMGYRTHVFSPDLNSPTGQVSDRQTIADYADTDAVAQFAQTVDVVTLEFENVSTVATETAARWAPVHPSTEVLHTAQNRLREKNFLGRTGIACTPFASVTSEEQLDQAVSQIGTPSVLKTVAAGYDGKGQARVDTPADAQAAWDQLDDQPAILEGWVDYRQEFSVIVGRSPAGEVALYGPIANDHANHILDISSYPAVELQPIATEAQAMARAIAESLDMVGVICIEFFLTTDDRLLVNEIAPRPHNSGHLTIDACCTSQFEQQVRAICGLPLGSTEFLAPAAMANLLGDLWSQGEPNWGPILSQPGAHLHLYGKTGPQVGRKMGHLTQLAESAAEAARLVQTLRP